MRFIICFLLIFGCKSEVVDTGSTSSDTALGYLTGNLSSIDYLDEFDVPLIDGLYHIRYLRTIAIYEYTGGIEFRPQHFRGLLIELKYHAGGSVFYDSIGWFENADGKKIDVLKPGDRFIAICEWEGEIVVYPDLFEVWITNVWMDRNGDVSGTLRRSKFIDGDFVRVQEL